MTAHEENYCTCGNVSHPSEALARRHRQMPRSHFRAGSATCRPYSQIPPQLCSKATSHALDRVPGSSRVTLIYKLHIRIATITEITFQPHNARLVHSLDLLQASNSFIARSIQSVHVCQRMVDTVHREELPGSPTKLLQVRGPLVNDAKTVRENR